MTAQMQFDFAPCRQGQVPERAIPQEASPFESGARRTDPPGSHFAAAKHERTGQLHGNRRLVLEALGRHPLVTSRELAEREGLDRHMVARRLADLRSLELAAWVACRVSTREMEWRSC